MTTWDLFCAIHFDHLEVLGAKCASVVCTQPAVATVHWVTGPLRCCERCTTRWLAIADAFAMIVKIDRDPPRMPRGLDDAAQRFALMELT